MSELAKSVAYSCEALAAMQLPGLPVTRQGWDALVKRDGWRFREEKSKGRGGVRREYFPPPAVLTLIEAHQKGEFVQVPGRANPVRTVPPSASTSPAGPYSYAASMTAPWVPDAIAEVAVRAMLVLSNLPDIPASLSARQRSGLVLRLFELLMMATRGDYKKVQELINNEGALLAALRLAWEAESQDGAAG